MWTLWTCYSTIHLPPPLLPSLQDIYMDLRSNVLLHVSIEEIGMRSTRWALVSWAQRAINRQDGSVDVQTSSR